MKLHRVYYKEFSRTDKISIDNKSKINHLSNVLRLKEGSKLDVFDGEGNSSICKIVSLEKKKIVLKQIGDIEFQQPEKINLKVLMPYIKKENLFFAIQKVTEIGVSDISLFMIFKYMRTYHQQLIIIALIFFLIWMLLMTSSPSRALKIILP